MHPYLLGHCCFKESHLAFHLPLDKQHFENDFRIILIGTYFQAFNFHPTIIDADALFILPQDVNI
jgi:hypothetical protein